MENEGERHTQNLIKALWAWVKFNWKHVPRRRKWIVAAPLVGLLTGSSAAMGKDPRNILTWALQPFGSAMREVVREELKPVKTRQDQQGAAIEYLAEITLEDKKMLEAKGRVDERRRAEIIRRRERARMLDPQSSTDSGPFPFDPRHGFTIEDISGRGALARGTP